MICETCGEAAVQRQVTVEHAPVSSTVVYQTHAISLDEAEHHAVLQRIEAFHVRVHAIALALNSLPPEAKQLSAGRVLRFEVGGVKPSACEVRSKIIASAEILAYHQRVDFDLPPRAIDEQTPESLMAEFQEETKPLLAALKAKFDRGDF